MTLNVARGVRGLWEDRGSRGRTEKNSNGVVGYLSARRLYRLPKPCEQTLTVPSTWHDCVAPSTYVHRTPTTVTVLCNIGVP